MSPASLVDNAVHCVLFSLSHHATLRGLPPAPRAKINLSSVTISPKLFIGAFVMGAASDEVPNCHSNKRPSVVEQATKYSPQLSIDQVVASTTLPVSGLGVP